MNKDIILRTDKELTEEQLQKIRLEMEEFKKSIRHDTIFYQALYISLIVLLLSVLLEVADLLFGYWNISKINSLSTKLLLIILLLFVVKIRYKSFLFLEGKPAIYIPEEHFKNKSTSSKTINKP
ncbi:hypothetical protein HYX00_04225 [Candidatus Woesearchaeota archaeon]|nr:hypothetical protein [Candidatus Woesearchaeota archaeon]